MAMSMRDIDKLDEGIALGIDFGEKRGIKLGEKRGEKRGVQLERKNVITTMLNNNCSIEEIHKMAGFSISEIKEIKEDYFN